MFKKNVYYVGFDIFHGFKHPREVFGNQMAAIRKGGGGAVLHCMCPVTKHLSIVQKKIKGSRYHFDYGKLIIRSAKMTGSRKGDEWQLHLVH